MALHPLLRRQLHKLGLDAAEPPDAAGWRQALERVSRTYSEGDLDRYTLERSIAISSEEMQGLHQQLTAEGDRLKVILHSIGDGLCVLDPAGLIQLVNPAGARLLAGSSQVDLVGASLLQLVSGGRAHVERPIEELVACLGSRRSMRCDGAWFFTVEGRSIPVSFSLTPIAGDGPASGAALLFQDITARLRDEEMLRESEARYRSIFHGSPLPMLVYDVETMKFLAVNPAAARHYGFTWKEFLDMRLSHLHASEPGPPLHRPAGLNSTGSETHRRKDGSIIFVELNTEEVVLGGRAARLAIVHDVTDQRALEQRVLQSQKMAAVGQLAGGLAHEINNPLGVILGFAEDLAENMEEADPIHIAVTSILREAIRCKLLVQELLTFSRANKGAIESVDLNEAISATMPLLAARAKTQKVEIRVDLTSSQTHIETNRTQLQQVIINLATNALDAMAAGGTLTIRARSNPEGLRIDIEDTGAGIPKELQSRVFEPFFTTKEVGRGTGLGLSLVYEIVKRHGGTVHLESEVGRGTHVSLCFPAPNRTREPRSPDGASSSALPH